MKRATTHRNEGVLKLALPLFLLLLPYDRLHGEVDETGSQLLPLSADDAQEQGNSARQVVYSTIPWEGREYPRDEARRVLMDVIAAPETNAHLRANALEMVGRLKDRRLTSRLVSLYGALRFREEKAAILQAISLACDPTGFPLFMKVLDEEEDKIVRLFAASGLAQWNVRRGVAELMRLLEAEDEVPPPARWSRVGDYAFDLLGTYNRRKGWGFPDEAIRRAVATRDDLDKNGKKALYVGEMKTWFEVNKGRFPDWKPGDPLPEVEDADGQGDRKSDSEER